MRNTSIIQVLTASCGHSIPANSISIRGVSEHPGSIFGGLCEVMESTYSFILSRHSSLPTAAGLGWHRTSRRAVSGGVLHSFWGPTQATCGHARRSHSRPERYVGLTDHHSYNDYHRFLCPVHLDLEDPALLEIAELLDSQGGDKYTLMVLRNGDDLDNASFVQVQMLEEEDTMR